MQIRAAQIPHALQIQSVDWFGDRVGWVKLQLEARNRHNKVLSTLMFMRGAAAAVLPVFRCDHTDYVLLTPQPRVPPAEASVAELPVGIFDEDGVFVGRAADVIHEVCGCGCDCACTPLAPSEDTALCQNNCFHAF